MGLSRVLARLAARRPHLLVISRSGSELVRIAIETWCDQGDGIIVDTPADADLLVICGEVDERLSEAAAELWGQLPGPRLQVHVDSVAEVPVRIDAAQSWLGSPQSDTTVVGRDEWKPGQEPADHHDGDHDHGDHDHDHDDDDDDDDMSGHDMSGHDMSGHDMGDMEMPAGLEMADRADDRGGLKLDVVPVRL